MIFDPDIFATKLLDKLSPWLNVSGDSAKEQFSSHFFSNATICLVLLSLPWYFCRFLAFAPLVLTLYQEMIRDGHWKDIFSNTESGKDGRTDLLSRGLGATLPFLVLLWDG